MQSEKQGAARRGKGRATSERAATARVGSSPVQLDHLDRVLGYALRRAQVAVFNDFRRSFAELDIRPTQYAVLAILAEHPGLKQGDVSAALGIKRTNFVAVLDELERRGLARREAVADDRRSRALFLTEEGEALTARMHKMNATHEARLASFLGPGEAATLIALLRRLTDNLSAADENE